MRGFLPDLPRHLTACDVAVVQGGLTTCMDRLPPARPSYTSRSVIISNNSSTSTTGCAATEQAAVSTNR